MHLQEDAQGNSERVATIIVNGIKSLRQNSVVIDRDYWLKVTNLGSLGMRVVAYDAVMTPACRLVTRELKQTQA